LLAVDFGMLKLVGARVSEPVSTILMKVGMPANWSMPGEQQLSMCGDSHSRQVT
jgi:hypothetical protein